MLGGGSNKFYRYDINNDATGGWTQTRLIALGFWLMAVI